MNLTQAKRKANLKKWKAQGPAVIDSPLKSLHSKFPDERLPDGSLVMHPIYARALRFAKFGNGGAVKRMARLA